MANAENTATATVVEKVILKQNGVKRPESGTLTGALWDIADQLSQAANAPAQRKDVVDAYMKSVPGANVATANTQYARWVRYHDVSALIAETREKAKAERAAALEAEKEALKAAKQAKKDEEAKAKAAAKAEAAAAREAEREAKAKAKAEEKAAKDAAKAEQAAAAGEATA